ncbi:unnamed protein product, partial [marine sediment metagenome]
KQKVCFLEEGISEQKKHKGKKLFLAIIETNEEVIKEYVKS